MSAGTIYLDNNATTTLAPACLDVMIACLRNVHGNPSSKHSLGEQAKQVLMQARASVAASMGAKPAEMVFTSGGTESNHLAILGALALRPGKHHLITSAVEHPSSLALFAQLETQGYRLTRLPVDADGMLTADAVEAAIDPDTAMVSIMWVNNETGAIFPIEAIVSAARARGVLFHTDAVQAAGKLPIDVSAVPVDLLSISGHKLHGPKGSGALFVRKGLKLAPQLHGHQERGQRGSTENVAAIAGLGVACERLTAARIAEEGAHMQRLRDHLEAGILARIPGAMVNAAGAARVPNTTNIRFDGVEAEAILDRLDRAGVCASAGAACTGGGTEPSHVLRAMGLTPAQALSSVRFSLSGETTAADIERTLELLPAIVGQFTTQAA